MFYQVVPMDHFTYVSGRVAQPSAESEYNAACTTWMTSAHLWILNNEFMNKDPDVII